MWTSMSPAVTRATGQSCSGLPRLACSSQMKSRSGNGALCQWISFQNSYRAVDSTLSWSHWTDWESGPTSFQHTVVNSPGVTELYQDHVWRHHGLTDQMISDHGPQFMSAFMKELNRLLGIKTSPSTVYHPQFDGQMECLNQDLC